ncbi:MAG: 4-hydroxybenzoate octaprenyltransferase [Pseudomonadota bacterium]
MYFDDCAVEARQRPWYDLPKAPRTTADTKTVTTTTSAPIAKALMTSPPLPNGSEISSATVTDAPAGNWVDAYAPTRTRPYLRLARADRPIGTWLLVFPCLWSMTMAQLYSGQTTFNLWFAVLFVVGAFVMRGAGCAYNDYVDRDYDAQVTRTKSRPIPSGQVQPWQALALVAALGGVGLAVLLQFNTFTIILGISSLALVLVYPFMKRMTYWPQLILGLTFNWGALVGWSAITGEINMPALLLYIGAVSWTVGYDTIYAHQDKEDDLMLGLKSTAIKFADHTKTAVALLYGLTAICWAAAIFSIVGMSVSAIAMIAIAAHFAWQVATLDINDAQNCLTRFKSNREIGAILFAGLFIDLIWSTTL